MKINHSHSAEEGFRALQYPFRLPLFAELVSRKIWLLQKCGGCLETWSVDRCHFPSHFWSLYSLETSSFEYQKNNLHYNLMMFLKRGGVYD